jgi:hypothetical protein
MIQKQFIILLRGTDIAKFPQIGWFHILGVEG